MRSMLFFLLVVVSYLSANAQSLIIEKEMFYKPFSSSEKIGKNIQLMSDNGSFFTTTNAFDYSYVSRISYDLEPIWTKQFGTYSVIKQSKTEDYNFGLVTQTLTNENNSCEIYGFYSNTAENITNRFYGIGIGIGIFSDMDTLVPYKNDVIISPIYKKKMIEGIEESTDIFMFTSRLDSGTTHIKYLNIMDFNCQSSARVAIDSGLSSAYSKDYFFKTTNNHTAVLRKYFRDSVYLIKRLIIDNAGSKISEDSVIINPNDSRPFKYTIAAYSDKEFLMAGFHYQSGYTVTQDLHVVKFDFSIPHIKASIVQLSDNFYFSDVKIDKHGNAFVYGNYYDKKYNDKGFGIAVLDSSLNLKTEKNWKYYGTSTTADLFLSDDAIIFSGWITDTSETVKPYYFAKLKYAPEQSAVLNDAQETDSRFNVIITEKNGGLYVSASMPDFIGSGKIFDLSGSIVRTFNMDRADSFVDISDFPTGTYFVSVGGKGKTFFDKFIVYR